MFYQKSGRLIYRVTYNNNGDLKYMEDFLVLSARNQERAWEIIRETNIIGIWESVGAEPHLVGSLNMGLLMTHRDIDFHIYSDPCELQKSFTAMAHLAECPGIHRIEYTNLLHTEEKCIEWHAWYEDKSGDVWQIDMIHILKGSFYDGFFEKMAERIKAVLTPETKQLILQLKYETPETEKIMGIEYYQAVLRDGVRSYSELTAWRQQHPVAGVVQWMP